MDCRLWCYALHAILSFLSLALFFFSKRVDLGTYGNMPSQPEPLLIVLKLGLTCLKLSSDILGTKHNWHSATSTIMSSWLIIVSCMYCIHKKICLCDSFIFAIFPIHLRGKKKHTKKITLQVAYHSTKIWNQRKKMTLKRLWSTIGWNWHMGAGLTIFSADFKTFNLLHRTHLFTNLPLMLTVLILILLLSWSDSSLGDPARRKHEKCHCL